MTNLQLTWGCSSPDEADHRVPFACPDSFSRGFRVWRHKLWTTGTYAKTEEAQPPAGLSARPVDGRIPACQCLVRRGRVSTPDANGW